MPADLWRPLTWEALIGQAELKDRLQVHIASALHRKQAMDHVLLDAPPGMGKSTLMRLIAHYLGEEFLELTMPVKPSLLVGAVRTIHGVIALDEIHRATPSQQEDLLPLLESGLMITPGGQVVQNNHLTVIGATTERAKLIPPLRDRFMIKPFIDPYTDGEMAQIVAGMAKMAGMDMCEIASEILGRAAGGIPRVARQFVVAARDMICSDGPHKAPMAEDVLAFCSYDKDGLNVDHNRYLQTLSGLDGLAGEAVLTSMLRCSVEMLHETEYVLLRHGLVKLTPRGRELTTAGMRRAQGGPGE